ncbi:glycosyltransferase family 2 protein [Loktanella sp. D2R18]|uniref:glycosyltransferase family 2 protein n=1 Tax=Rhodobacterales TaxID=204455 RepID=UPI000DE8424A|nr:MULTISPECIES: glycosyltransferase family A protein [Rhodobacterales]MDO6591442.1 glycosyltransferase family A protein [Yoonia sp. 1_MG-2023]RBW43493.1 glycosyltransferase family 2 protein [Loktanella sp. D2R18]
MTRPLSIIIPTYNRPKLLRRAVQSALVACPDGAEIIVVDDRSDTAESALHDVISDSRLTVLTNPGDKGAAGARNAGAQVATGQILLFFDDDDTLIADYPGRVLAAAQTGANFGFSARMQVENGNEETEQRPELSAGMLLHDTPLSAKLAAFSAGYWVRRDAFFEVGGVAPDQVNDEDTDLCCKLYAQGHSAWYDPVPGCAVHSGYDTNETTAPQLTQSTDPTAMVACYVRTFQRHGPAFRSRPADHWFLLRRALRVAARTGTDDGAKQLLSGLRPRSLQIKGWLFWQMKKAGQHLR